MQAEQHYAANPAAREDSAVRASFVMRTYGHLIAAIAFFVVAEYALIKAGLGEMMLRALAQMPYGWLIAIGGFVVVGWMARSVAWSAKSMGLQYLALAVFVAFEAVLFMPLILIAEMQAPGVVQSAAWVTLMGFAGLTAVVWKMRADFQFLRGALAFGGIMALVAIVSAVVFGFELGTWFSVGMIVLAGMSILYDTSNIMLRYPADRHVSAALELFASVALLFWYVLRLMMQLQRD